jgi:hypothetical protein
VSDTPATPDTPRDSDRPQKRPRRASGGRAAAKEAAATAIAGGATLKAAAETANVGARTVRRWNEDPAFQTLVQDIRSRMVGTAVGKLSNGMSAAATALMELVESEDQHVKLKAARSVLELGVKLTELAELDRRIRVLEVRVAEKRS